MKNQKILNKKKILFLVTEDWYFCSHRLPLARQAKKQGFEVVVVTRVNEYRDFLVKEGYKVIPIQLRKHRKMLFHGILSIIRLIKIYRREKPNIVHHVSMQPVIYGSIAAYFYKVPLIVNALSGLGHVFTARGIKARFLRKIIKIQFRYYLNRNNARVIVQTQDDFKTLVQKISIKKKQLVLIPGAGVDISRFQYSQEQIGPIRVVMVARMLWDKGVGVFVEAARLLREKNKDYQMILVGFPDPENPTVVPEKQLIDWKHEGIIDWWGKRTDIDQIWQGAHMAVLPTSYGEGIPKSLLEAAACGRPMIATNIPGCRDLVKDGQNGLLIPEKDSKALAEAIIQIAENKSKRIDMGKNARKLVEERYSESFIIQQTFQVYALAGTI